MGPCGKTQDSRPCPFCMETRTNDDQISYHRRHIPPLLSRMSCSHQTSGQYSRKTRRSVLFHCTLLILLIRPDFTEATCSAGQPHIGYMPTVPETQLKLQHDTPPEDCADLCCKKKYCDLAWVWQHRCFHVRCLTISDCIPEDETGDQSSVVYIVDRSPVHDSYSESGILCNPYDKWDTCPVGESCSAASGQCECNEETVRNPETGRCQLDQSIGDKIQPSEHDPAETSSIGTGLDQYEPAIPDKGETSNQASDSQNTANENEVDNMPSDEANLGKYRFCESDDSCEPLEYCFGLERFGTGICHCKLELNALGECIGQISGAAVTESQNGTEALTVTPVPSTLTQEGTTQTKTGTDVLTERLLNTEGKTKVETSSETPVQNLVVSAGENQILQLPGQDSTTLNAYVIPKDRQQGDEYRYEWRVLDRPEGSSKGEMVGEHAQKLQLAKLSAGVYTFQIEVRSKGSYGSATVNVTVLAPPRVNTPPHAVISPSSQTIMLPNPETFLDASGSTDDDKIVGYHWEEIKGPVRESKITGDTQTLKLTDLVPGFYVIRLTVTDSDGVSDSAQANVTVKEEIDNPPIAKAGKDVLIKLPVNSAVLYGNGSFDDHPGMEYEWSKVSGPVADMSGSSLAILHLNGLEEGTYVFRLTVTDSKGQTDLDEATVIVKPENNLPPTADAGPDKELSLPDDSTTLDGSGSTDDLGVTWYYWEKVSGPNDPKIEFAHQQKAKVSGLVAGHYVFKLTVGDKQDAKSSDTVDVVIKKEVNIPPVANAGPDITIHLPNDVVNLDGSASKDDKGIVSYEWKRGPKSPAAGSAVGNSAHEVILKLKGLVAGVYHMTLNVTDAKGASSTDTAVVTVVQDPHRLNLVEITFDIPVSRFTHQDKTDMTRSLAVLLSVRDADIKIQQVYQTPSEQLQISFYATNATSKVAIPGPSVVKMLNKKKLNSETDLLKFRVLELDTTICQKNCSGHGVCNAYTRLCICESFWMENYVRTWLGDGESNCDWSILYVIIVAFVVAIAFAGLCWLCICCIKRSRRKVKRRRRYNLLSQDLDGTESLEMLPKNGNGKQSSSIMISESDDDSDEETTLFDSKKRQAKNGKANGAIITAIQPRKKRPFPLMSSRTEKL